MASSTDSPGKSVQSVLNTLRILEEVATLQPAGVTELAKAAGMPKSSVHRFLLTLQRAGWVDQVGREVTRWRLTPKALTIGLNSSSRLSFREAALPVMQQMRDETHETVHLALRDNSTVVIIERLDSDQAVRTFVRLGTRAPMHATASGRAILARLSSEDITHIIDLGLPRYTDTTITDPTALRNEIDATSRRGYAINNCGWRHHVAAVATAVTDSTTAPVGALTISIPTVRWSDTVAADYGLLASQAATTIGESMTDTV